MLNKRDNKMEYYYEFSGRKYGLPLSMCINSFETTLFHQHKQLEIIYVLSGSCSIFTEQFEQRVDEHEIAIIAPEEMHMITSDDEDSATQIIIQIDTGIISSDFIDVNSLDIESSVISHVSDAYAGIKNAFLHLLRC